MCVRGEGRVELHVLMCPDEGRVGADAADHHFTGVVKEEACPGLAKEAKRHILVVAIGQEPCLGNLGNEGVDVVVCTEGGREGGREGEYDMLVRGDV